MLTLSSSHSSSSPGVESNQSNVTCFDLIRSHQTRLLEWTWMDSRVTWTQPTIRLWRNWRFQKLVRKLEVQVRAIYIYKMITYLLWWLQFSSYLHGRGIVVSSMDLLLKLVSCGTNNFIDLNLLIITLHSFFVNNNYNLAVDVL